MLYDSDLTVYDIQDFCADSLKNSAEFSSFCTTTIQATLNFETDAVMNDIDMLPPLPYCTVHGGNENQDLRQPEWGHEYEIVLVFGIADTTSETNPKPPFQETNGMRKYTSARNIEKIAKKAILVLKETMQRTGINGDYDIQIISANGTKTATGEADDMNYILSLSFSYLENLQKGC